MDIKRTIELLKQKSNEAPYVASLSPHNNEYIPWRRNIEDILETKFGVNSTEYNRIHVLQISTSRSSSLQSRYKNLIRRIQLEVNSIIQKYEMLGLDISSQDKSQDKSKDDNNITNLDILFDGMNFHPRIIEVSESLYKTGNYASAILEAFKAVNNFVKEKSGLSYKERRGISDKQLMAKVFDEHTPLIKLNELSTDTDISEQEGFKFLFMGATAGIRNPKAHDSVVQIDPYKTLEYLGFASLLMKKIDFWEVR